MLFGFVGYNIDAKLIEQNLHFLIRPQKAPMFFERVCVFLSLIAKNGHQGWECPAIQGASIPNILYKCMMWIYKISHQKE